MKLFIWEGHGISTGYHNDGTLIVLAVDVKQARTIARKNAKAWYDRGQGPDEWKAKYERGDPPTDTWTDGYEKIGIYYDWKEGTHNPALRRQPDRVIDCEETTPCVIVFNGGGYD